MTNYIISQYKHQQYLPEAIASLRNQDHNRLRILLFNDEPGANLDGYNLLVNPKVETFNDGANLGQSVRFNAGLDISIHQKQYKCDWISFHGADDISMPWRTKQLLYYTAMTHEEPDIVYSDAIINHGGNKSFYSPGPFNELALRENNYIVASSVFFKTSFLKKNNLTFDSYRTYGEDWIFYNKCIIAGATFAYIPMPLVEYRSTHQIFM